MLFSEIGKRLKCLTTPKPNKLIKDLVKRDDCFVTSGSTFENEANLADSALKMLKEKYDGILLAVAHNKFSLIDRLKKEIPSALFPELNSKISSPALVTALSSKLELAISIDNGVMHMMNLANVPMIVLFGPTDSKKFAPKNTALSVTTVLFVSVVNAKLVANFMNSAGCIPKEPNLNQERLPFTSLPK